MKKTIPFLVLLIASMFINCKKNSSEAENTASVNNDSIVVEKPVEVVVEDEKEPSIDNPLMRFKIMPVESDINGNPNSKIYVSSDTKLDFVASVLGNAKEIKKAEFVKMNIPKNAIAACGSWWAGSGTYFYISETKKGYEVFKGSQDEETLGENADYKWELVKSLF